MNPSLLLSSQVYECLNSGIVQAHLRPGDRASEVEVSKQLQVSRQPVRDAFLRLQKEGLLDIRPFIEKISIKAVLEARFLREAIEADIVALLAQCSNKEVIATLKEQIKAQHKMAKGDLVGFMKLDDLFHRTLAEAADKSHAWYIVEGLKSHMDRLRFLSFHHHPIKQTITEHASIVDAIESGSPTDAARFIRKHLREVLKSLPTTSNEYPDFSTRLAMSLPTPHPS